MQTDFLGMIRSGGSGAQVLQGAAEDDGDIESLEQKTQERPFHSTTT